MKTLLGIVTIIVLMEFLCNSCVKDSSNEINIQDENFLNALLNMGLDSNANGKIESDETLGITSLELNDKGISILMVLRHL